MIGYSPLSIPFTTDGRELAQKENVNTDPDDRCLIVGGVDNSGRFRFFRISANGAILTEITSTPIDVRLTAPNTLVVNVQNTPLDVNVQNTMFDVNVQNSPLNVNVQNSPLGVNVQNASLNVNVQNTSLSVEVTNPSLLTRMANANNAIVNTVSIAANQPFTNPAILSPNPLRKLAIFYFSGTGRTCYVKLGPGGATPTNFSFIIPSGSTVTIPEGFGGTVGVNITSVNATALFCVTEITY